MWCDASPLQWIFSQHWGCWWPDDLAPGHQYAQCWICMHAFPDVCELTHLPVVTHICVNESGQHWLRQWCVAYAVPSHYLNQCWVIVNWTLRNKLQWNFDQNTFMKMYLKILSAKRHPFCPGGDQLSSVLPDTSICPQTNIIVHELTPD